MDDLPVKFTDAAAGKLRKFLAAGERPPGTMTYCQLEGFLFAVGCSPETIMPSEWLPMVFAHEEPGYESERQLRQITGAMLALYNRIIDEAYDAMVHLPAGCPVLKETMANFGQEASLGQWAEGFWQGHTWLRELWTDFLIDEMEEEFDAVVLVLSFFSDLPRAADFFQHVKNDRESRVKEKTLEKFAAKFLQMFPDALESYAGIGRTIHKVMIKLDVYEDAFLEAGDADDLPEIPGPGRNDPCPPAVPAGSTRNAALTRR